MAKNQPQKKKYIKIIRQVLRETGLILAGIGVGIWLEHDYMLYNFNWILAWVVVFCIFAQAFLAGKDK